MKLLSTYRDSIPLLRANSSITERPDRLVRAMKAGLPYGQGVLAAVASSAGRYPNVPAIITPDERLSYRQLWDGATALADGLVQDGVTQEMKIGLVARNSPMFLEAVVAAAMVGSDLVLLNTAMGPAQLRDVVEAEDVSVVLCDDEYAAAFAGTRVYAGSAIREMVARRPIHRMPRPTRDGRLIILTSGTTGRPKGASRGSDGGVAGVSALLGSVPLRLRDTMVVPAPFFHAWGLANALIGLGLSATIVTTPGFDPEEVLTSIQKHRARALVVVPTMMHRICELPAATLASVDTSSLKVIASSGSAMSGRLATEILDRFGPVLYNIYGSTEVATATVASPRDLRDAPTTAGRPAYGVRVAIFDDEGAPVKRGEVGRIFVRNGAKFDGYTNGGGKEAINGLLSTGDVGHFDKRGLLFVNGRDDDMIVSGGENVYPVEVEELLNHHPAVAEAVVVGIPDEKFGKVLQAVIVLRTGQNATEDELKEYVSQNLARFKVPRVFKFVEALPRTATGKVLRRELV